MDEETLERVREELMQQLMGLSLNQDSDAEDDYDNNGNDNDNDNDNDNENEEEEDEEVVEDLDDEDDDSNYEGEEEFEWYDWPDQSKLATLDDLPDFVTAEEMEDTGERITLDYLRNPALDSDQDDDVDVVKVVKGGGGSVGTDGEEGASNAPDQILTQGDNVVDGEVKKKKKKKKKNRKRNMPMADDDLIEEPEQDQELVDAEAAKIYKPTMSPDERFRLAMENFRKERVFNAITSQILSTYFTFGGMDPNQAASIHTSNDDIEIEVDLIYVVSAFLSSFLISSSGWYDAEYFTTAPKVVASFLRYLVLKRVIPEYDDDLRQAIEIAQRAKVEAPKCQKFNNSFPDSFNETCSILYVRDFEYDALPDDSLERMEQVAGIRVATEVELRGKEIRHMRIVVVEPMDPLLLKVDTVESTDESLSTEQQQQSSVVPYSRVTLVKLPIGWGANTTTTKSTTTTGVEEEQVTIFVESELAGYLDIGTVVWGTFFTLSNGVVFARPLGAHPSFFVEQDDSINDD